MVTVCPWTWNFATFMMNPISDCHETVSPWTRKVTTSLMNCMNEANKSKGLSGQTSWFDYPTCEGKD